MTGVPVVTAADAVARASGLAAEFGRLWTGEKVNFSGKHLSVQDARLGQIPDPLPALTWGEPPAAVHDKIEKLRKLAADEGRQLRFGIRLHVIARDTSEQAWAEAARLLELNGGSKDNLEIYPNLWAGVGLVRGGAGTAMVGSYTEIADLIEQYVDAGMEEFVLSGYPHLEESYWFGEGVLPELSRRGLWRHPAPVSSRPSVPFGASV